MLLFIGVSIGWGVMFMTDSTAVWKAMVLLLVHGLAGVIWLPASQVLIHRIVGVEQLASAVRLNATGRYMGFLVGPAVGSGVAAAVRPDLRHFHQCAHLCPDVHMAHAGPLWALAFGRRAPRTRDHRLCRNLVDDAGNGGQSGAASMTVLVGCFGFLHWQCLPGANAGVRV